MARGRHGAHLEFVPATAPLPPDWPRSSRARGALCCGGELVVQSTHKVLGSLTQSAMLHASARALEAHPSLAAALGAALEQVQSSSPSYPMLASLDGARWQMAAPRAACRWAACSAGAALKRR